MAVDTDTSASVAADGTYASGASVADADMVVGTVVGVTVPADALAMETDGALDPGDMAVDAAVAVAASSVAADPAAGMAIATADTPIGSARGGVAVEPDDGAPVAPADQAEMSVDTAVGVAAQRAPTEKRGKRYSAGPQAKRRVAQYHNVRQSNAHPAVADASQRTPDGGEVDGGV